MSITLSGMGCCMLRFTKNHSFGRRPRLYSFSVLALLYLFHHVGLRAAPNDPEVSLAEADRLADLGNLYAARDLYAEAEKIFTARADRRKALYAKFGRLRRDVEMGSYDAYLQELNRDLSGPEVQADPLLRIRGLSVKGVIAMNLDVRTARSTWQEIEKLAAQIGEPKWANRASGQLGLLAGLEGDYGLALNKLLGAISTASKIHDVSAEVYFRTYLGNGMTVNNNPTQGLNLLNSAIAISGKSPDSGYPIVAVIGKIKALRALQRPKEALELIESALEFARKNDILGAQTELLVQLGRFANDTGDLDRAEGAFREAARIASAAGLPRMQAVAHSGLVDAYQSRGNLSEASKAAAAAVEAVRRPQDIYDVPHHLARKAEIEAEMGNIAGAESLYNEARAIVEAMLVNMPSSPAKSSLIATVSKVYSGQFRLSAEKAGGLPRAFAVVEQARGRSLADSLRYGNRRIGEVPDRWEDRITEIQQKMRSSRSPADHKKLLNELEHAETQLAGVESVRSRRALREMALLGTKPVSLGSLQAILSADEAVLHYVLNDATSFCLEITRSDARIHRLEGKRKLESAIDRFLSALRRKQNPIDEAKYLHSALLPGTLQPNAKTLIVVPDGKLHLLPFAALVGPDSRFLAESKVVMFAPSGNVLHVLRSRKNDSGMAEKAPLFGLGFSGETIPSKTDISQTRGFFDSRGASFKPLPFAREELLAVEKETGQGSTVLLGKNASEAALKQQDLSRFRILHFAAHAIASERDPERAGLVMHSGSDSEDGLWQPREIRRQNMQADLVTLSACETALGKIEGQAGIANLATAFLLAGTRNVVASLWMVDDRSTATIMTYFYARLRKSESIAEAMRGAQMDMLTQFGRDMAPYYWAGFSVIGDGKRQIPLRTTTTVGDRSRTGLR